MDNKSRYSKDIMFHFDHLLEVMREEMSDLLANGEFRSAEEMEDDVEAVIMQYAKEGKR